MRHTGHQCWDTLGQDIPNWHTWPLFPPPPSVFHLPAIETHNNYLLKFYDCKSIILGFPFSIKRSVFYFYLCACLLFIYMNGYHSYTGAPCLSVCMSVRYVPLWVLWSTYVVLQSLSVMPRIRRCLKRPEGASDAPGEGFVSPVTDMELGAGLRSPGEQQEGLNASPSLQPPRIHSLSSFCPFLLSCFPLFRLFLFDVKDWGSFSPHCKQDVCVHDRNF